MKLNPCWSRPTGASVRSAMDSGSPGRPHLRLSSGKKYMFPPLSSAKTPQFLPIFETRKFPCDLNKPYSADRDQLCTIQINDHDMKTQKVWFVTGASKGLGLSLVKRLLNE